MRNLVHRLRVCEVHGTSFFLVGYFSFEKGARGRELGMGVHCPTIKREDVMIHL